MIGQFRPPSQNGEHPADRKLQHEISLQIKMLRVNLQNTHQVHTRKIAERSQQFSRTVGAGDQGEPVKTLPLSRRLQQFGDVGAPSGLRIGVRSWQRHRRVFHHVQNRRISKLRQAAEMIVERITIDVGFPHDIGNRDFVIVARGQQLPERVFHAFFGGKDFRVSTWSWHACLPFMDVRRAAANMCIILASLIDVGNVGNGGNAQRQTPRRTIIGRLARQHGRVANAGPPYARATGRRWCCRAPNAYRGRPASGDAAAS